MHDLAHKLAVALLALAAFAALVAAWPAEPPAGLLPAYRQWLLLGLAAALSAAVLLPALRPPAIASALLVKLAYLAASVSAQDFGHAAAALAPELAQTLLLLAAGGIFLYEARQEARWNGVLPLRQEG